MTTKTVKWLSAFIVLVMLAVAVPQTASAQGLPTVTITEDTVLTADLNAYVVIGADGITLDGAGHSIIGENTGYESTSGISLIGRSGVTIKNCRVIGSFGVGIYLLESSYNKIINNTVDGSLWKGFRLLYSDHNIVTDNTATRIGKGRGLWDVGFGGFSDQGHSNIVSNNTAIDIEGNGFIGQDMKGNTATGCQVGFYVIGFQPQPKYVEGNLAYGNSVAGFCLHFCKHATLVNNTAYGNGYGFYLFHYQEFDPWYWPSKNHIVGNTVINNEYAFVLRYAHHNLIMNNVGYGNMYNITAWLGCEHNKFIHNVFDAPE